MVDNLDNDGELASVGAIVDKDHSADFDEPLEKFLDFFVP